MLFHRHYFQQTEIRFLIKVLAREEFIFAIIDCPSIFLLKKIYIKILRARTQQTLPDGILQFKRGRSTTSTTRSVRHVPTTGKDFIRDTATAET